MIGVESVGYLYGKGINTPHSQPQGPTWLMKMEQTECSETLAFKLQTPVNHPEKKSIRRSSL
jgi:hypothetical protein